jgi:hypothetical protein
MGFNSAFKGLKKERDDNLMDGGGWRMITNLCSGRINQIIEKES